MTKSNFEAVVDRDSFVDAVAIAARVVEARNSIPILGGVLIEAMAGGALELTCSDLDLFVSVPMVAEGSKGATVVPVATLLKLAKGLPKGPVTLAVTTEHNEERFTVKAGRSNLQLKTMDPADFPAPDKGKPATTFKVSSATLLEMIGKTKVSMSTEESRYYLCGVFFTVDKRAKLFKAVSTDGHRLTVVSSPMPEGANIIPDHNGNPGFILPRKAALEIFRALPNNAVEVTVTVHNLYAVFDIPGVGEFASKLIDGTYPDYQRVIPNADSGSEVIVKTADLKQALSSTKAISSRNGSTAVKLALVRDTMEVSVRDAENGFASQDIDSSWKGTWREVGFNVKYLEDFLALIEGPAVTFTIVDPGSPARITDPSRDNVLFVLMPMRV